jgi:peptidoglycan/xylan/chitin deacetylase (PgdA/CDA1 family)
MKPAPYGPFPYSPIIDRAPLNWPDGARVALWIIPNIEFFPLNMPVPGGFTPKAPDVPNWSSRDYGNRVGVFRLMEVMDRYGLRGTVALNSMICAQHPAIIEQGEARGWEWMGHNETNSRRLGGDMPLEEEKRIIREAFSIIGDATGRRPKGWLGSGLTESWDTLDLLADEGLEYICDWVNDDQPYMMTLESGRKLVSVPYSFEVNDKNQFDSMKLTGRQFGEMIRDQFDVLYREGEKAGHARVMAIALHPYLVGQPHRIGGLDAALEYICGHAGVWKTTGSEIAQHFLAQQK